MSLFGILKVQLSPISFYLGAGECLSVKEFRSLHSFLGQIQPFSHLTSYLAKFHNFRPNFFHLTSSSIPRKVNMFSQTANSRLDWPIKGDTTLTRKALKSIKKFLVKLTFLNLRPEAHGPHLRCRLLLFTFTSVKPLRGKLSKKWISKPPPKRG